MYWKLFKIFSKIGAFTIGGGAAMIPIIEEEIIDKNKWLTSEEFIDIISIAQSAPGLIAVNVSIFVGHKIGGLKGSIVATIGGVLPPFIIILLIASIFTSFQDNETVQAVLKGIRPVVVALIAAPVLRMAIKSNLNLVSGSIIAVTVILVGFLGVSPIYIIIAAIVGALLHTFYLSKKIKR